MVFLEILILISIISVILAPAIIRSALFLMQTFFLAGIYLAILGTDIIALLFLLVYVGAIGVLFLFVIMLIQFSKNELIQFPLNHDTVDMENTTFDILFSIIGVILLLLLFFSIFLSLLYSFPIIYKIEPLQQFEDPITNLYDTSAAHTLGSVLFLDFWFPFIVITLIIVLISFGVIVILK